MLKFLHYKATLKGIKLWENCPCIWESKIHKLTHWVGPSTGAFKGSSCTQKKLLEKTTYDLRKDNNIKYIYIYIYTHTPWSSQHCQITILKAKMDKIPICTLVTIIKTTENYTDDKSYVPFYQYNLYLLSSSTLIYSNPKHGISILFLKKANTKFFGSCRLLYLHENSINSNSNCHPCNAWD